MVETQIEPSTQTVLLATFFVRDALCALDASRVQEVIRVETVTLVRHAPAEVAGVINLRGKIVTLLDLGTILGFGKSEVTRESRVFIIEDRNEFLGVLVDRVGEVIEIEPGHGDSLPVNIPATQARFFQGVRRAGGHVIAILNPAEVLNEARL
ncbi:MAG: chemotaxis protein CheW [Bryobacteraceae bacterium]|jgi:purine-binding chemotaxis protein CheW